MYVLSYFDHGIANRYANLQSLVEGIPVTLGRGHLILMMSSTLSREYALHSQKIEGDANAYFWTVAITAKDNTGNTSDEMGPTQLLIDRIGIGRNGHKSMVIHVLISTNPRSLSQQL